MNMKISVASVPYFWSQQGYQDFYRQLADSPVDIVYLGETICSKRRSMKLQDWLAIAELLTQAGKQVVLSTLTLLEAESELSYLTGIASQKDYLIEANDMAALQVAHDHSNHFVAGNAINIYNNSSLARLHRIGMTRWCVPVELGKTDLAPMIESAKALGVEIEYQVFGRLPLAFSARCFTARHLQLAKDDCQFKCLDYEQGILVNTQEGDGFVQINGIQTQSSKVNNLLDRLPELEQSGIDILRVVPVSARDTLRVIQHLHALLKNSQELADSSFDVDMDYEYCNGYWLQQEGMKYIA